MSGAAAPHGYPLADSRPLTGSQPGHDLPGHDLPGHDIPGQDLPAAGYPQAPVLAPRPVAGAAAPRPPSAWPEICERMSLRLLALAEQLRISLDELEADEADPERLRRLYQIDHAATRMRRVGLDLRTLAGRGEGELGGPVTSLLDIIRMALSAIERYAQVSVAKVADLAVLGYAADDVGLLVAALLDNATRYSPGLVTVSAHLAWDGSVLFRVEDTGIGMEPAAMASVNAALGGPVPEIDQRTGLRTGFPVIHRIARKHQIGVRLATRPSPARGTIAMAALPVQLLCEIPDLVAGGPVPVPASRPPAGGPAAAPGAAGRTPAAGQRPGPSRRSGWAQPTADAAESPAEPAQADGLPRREPASLRGDLPGRGTRDGTDGQPSAELSAEARAAARRAFADDLTAFSLGSQEPTGEGTVPR